MDKKNFKDPEKQNFSKLFFLLGVLLVGALGWELWAEAIGRQPWIGYQERFKELELEGAKEQLAQAKKTFEIKQKSLADAPPGAEPTNIENYKERLSQAESLLNSEDYRKSLAEAEELKKKLSEQTTENRFVKADLDAAYYTLDAATEKKESTGGPQAEVDALKKKLEESRYALEITQTKLKEVNHRVSLAEEALQKAKFDMDRETQDLVNAEQRIVKLEARPAAIQQVVIDGLGEYQRVDRCTSCHLGIDRAEFANAKDLVFRAHPRREEIFKQHPIEKTGCTVCHDGQGRALTEEEAHQGDEHWHQPMLAKAMVNASCVRCHANAPLLSETDNVIHGAVLFQTRGCIACHKVDNSPYLLKAMEKLGPDLSNIKSKVSHQWLASWIQDPKHIHPRTLMPEFGVKGKGMKQEDAASIASYLESQSGSYKPSPSALAYASSHEASPQSLALGEQIFKTRGCMGCHDLGPAKASGPRHVALDGAGLKLSPEWIYTWVENPRQISKTTIMPNFRLKPEEIGAIADYISSLKKPETENPLLEAGAGDIDQGKKLVRTNGCYSCHSIPGFENLSDRIGPELTEFASKDPHLLFWGTKDVVSPEKRNWLSWTKAKLNEPKAFESDRIAVVMPNFHLEQSEIDDLSTFLKTLNSEQKISKENRRLWRNGEKELVAGQQMLNHYGCIGCHAMYDQSKTQLTAFHREPLVKYGKIAPNLSPEGERVRSEWLADFIRSPYKMRPYLLASMPTFNLDEEDQAAFQAYFKASCKHPQFVGSKETLSISPKSNSVVGKKLLEQHQCISCHQVGGKELPATTAVSWYRDVIESRKFAPDLAHSMRKLDANWANRWMENPNAIMPDTSMPYLSLTREQVSQIRSYLKTLPAAGSETEVVAKKSASKDQGNKR